MQDILKTAFNPETFRQQGYALIDSLASYLASVQQENLPVIPHQEPEAQLTYWQEDFNKPLASDPLPLLEDILKRSIHLHHPQYMGHQVAPPLPLAALMGVVTGLLNNGMALYEMGEVSTVLERIVTDWLAKKVGFPETSLGFLTSGGTLATLTALLTARSANVLTDVWQKGTKAKLAVMVSEEAHYCVDRAVRVMGLGSEGIIKIPANERFQMRTDLLAEYYEQAQAQGIHVFAVVGSACSTATGSYDDLSAIADFCSKYGLWFHVDGAHGGAVVVSKKYKPLVKGMERADSLVIDFHKMLMMPALITAVLYRQGEHGFQSFQQSAQYLWSNQHSYEWFNLGKRTFECTKTMMSMKVYTALRTYGEELFTANVEYLYEMARKLAKLISERTEFELCTEPEANIVCFRYVGKNIPAELLDQVNTSIRQQMLKEGRFYIVKTTLRGRLYLRVSLMNPLTTEQYLQEMLNEITKQALHVFPSIV